MHTYMYIYMYIFLYIYIYLRPYRGSPAPPPFYLILWPCFGPCSRQYTAQEQKILKMFWNNSDVDSIQKTWLLCGCYGCFWVPSWGQDGAKLGPSWGQVGPSWAKLGPSWAKLGQVGVKLDKVGPR